MSPSMSNDDDQFFMMFFFGVLSTSFIIILSLILWEIMFLIYLENKLLNYLLHVYFFFFSYSYYKLSMLDYQLA